MQNRGPEMLSGLLDDSQGIETGIAAKRSASSQTVIFFYVRSRAGDIKRNKVCRKEKDRIRQRRNKERCKKRRGRKRSNYLLKYGLSEIK